MKVLSLVVATLLSTATADFGFSTSQVTALEDPTPVPGDNPLTFCTKPSDDDILKITKVDISPNPPEAGKTLTVTASGTFRKDVEEGAKVHLQVKYGLIRLINQDADLCEQVKNVDLECPLKKGDMELTKDIDLPKEIPPGKYTVIADVVDKDGKKITCLQATIVFSRKTNSFHVEV